MKVKDFDDFFFNLCKLVFDNGEEQRVEGLFDRIIEYYYLIH